MVSGLKAGREYEFMVLSQDEHGDGMFSKAIRVKTAGEVRRGGQNKDGATAGSVANPSLSCFQAPARLKRSRTSSGPPSVRHCGSWDLRRN